MCAAGGVDAESGVLVHKRVKVEALEEAEQVVVDVEVWVEVRAPDGTPIPGIELQAASLAAEPFAAARVVSLGDDGSRCVVRWRDGAGEPTEVPRRRVSVADQGGAKVNNLQLLRLNEANLLHNVRARFEAGHIYTHTGQLELLVVNPYEARPELYDEVQIHGYHAYTVHAYAVRVPCMGHAWAMHMLCMGHAHAHAVHVPCMGRACAMHMPCTCRAQAAMRSYRDAGKTREAEPPPHSYAVAERVYRTLLEASSGAAQSVVVSGESGAGKTETNKHLISYLRWRAGGGSGGGGGRGSRSCSARCGARRLTRGLRKALSL